MPPLDNSIKLYSALKEVNHNFMNTAHDEYLFDQVVKEVFRSFLGGGALLSNTKELVLEWKELSRQAAKYLDLPFDSQVSQSIKQINAFLSLQSFFPGTACDDVTQLIFSYIANSRNALLSPISKQLSPLACVCKKWNYAINKLQIAHALEHRELKEQRLKFLNAKCKTAAEAVEFIITHQLKVDLLNLFTDLTQDLLEHLFRKNPRLKHLIIWSSNIKQLPKECRQLETLYCSFCKELTSLPDMPHLTNLDCSSCEEIERLPASLTQLISLDCDSCFKLTYLPDMMHLERLNCTACVNLQSLPKCLKQLVMLRCSGCDLLKSLPESLARLKWLQCGSPSLIGLENFIKPATLRNLTSLTCSASSQLTSLPYMPSLSVFKSFGCSQLIIQPGDLPKDCYIDIRG